MGFWGGSFDFGFLLFFDLIKCVLKENEQKSTFSWVLLGENTLYSELSGIKISANRNFAAFYVVILSNFAALYIKNTGKYRKFDTFIVKLGSKWGKFILYTTYGALRNLS